MEDNAARRAAETLLGEHKANVQFKPLGPPDSPATISDAYDIQDRYVALLRGDFGDSLQVISIDDVDWPSWQGFYAQGRSPRSAIERALERDL